MIFSRESVLIFGRLSKTLTRSLKLDNGSIRYPSSQARHMFTSLLIDTYPNRY